MNAPAKITPDFQAIVSWANRLDMYRGSRFQHACLESIHAEARTSGNDEWLWAAQAALDTGGDLSELDELIAAEDEAEREGNRIRWYEAKSGRDWQGEAL